MHNFRHAALTCGYIRAIDKRAMLSPLRWARQVARSGAVIAVTGGLCFSLLGPIAYATSGSKSLQSLAKMYIHNNNEYKCFNYIVTKESRWNPKAKNPASTAYGIGQLLNETSQDAFEQVVNASAYIKHRYGTMCRAKTFHQKHGWY